MVYTKMLMFIVLLGLTYLIDKQMNKDMSSGFSIGMLWMIVIRFIAEIFTQQEVNNDKGLFFKQLWNFA